MNIEHDISTYIYYPLFTRSAGGVDVVIPVEGEAVLADLVHEQVGLQVQRAPARAVTARSVETEVTMVLYTALNLMK